MVDVDAAADIAAMNFEEALAELEQIVRRLEGGQADRSGSTKQSFFTSGGHC